MGNSVMKTKIEFGRPLNNKVGNSVYEKVETSMNVGMVISYPLYRSVKLSLRESIDNLILWRIEL